MYNNVKIICKNKASDIYSSLDQELVDLQDTASVIDNEPNLIVSHTLAPTLKSMTAECLEESAQIIISIASVGIGVKIEHE